MRFELIIDSCNDAFAEDPAAEVARILKHTATALEAGVHEEYDEQEVTIYDINGNRCGFVNFGRSDS